MDIESFSKEYEPSVKEWFRYNNWAKLDFTLFWQNFLIKINPIIREYMKNNSIDILLEKKQIYIGKSSVNITEDIIELINKKPNNG